MPSLNLRDYPRGRASAPGYPAFFQTSGVADVSSAAKLFSESASVTLHIPGTYIPGSPFWGRGRPVRIVCTFSDSTSEKSFPIPNYAHFVRFITGSSGIADVPDASETLSDSMSVTLPIPGKWTHSKNMDMYSSDFFHKLPSQHKFC